MLSTAGRTVRSVIGSAVVVVIERRVDAEYPKRRRNNGLGVLAASVVTGGTVAIDGMNNNTAFL